MRKICFLLPALLLVLPAMAQHGRESIGYTFIKIVIFLLLIVLLVYGVLAIFRKKK